MPLDEFALIDHIVAALGDRAADRWVQVGPGDDAAVVSVRDGFAAVSSIDTLVAGVHFPHSAPAELIGYRALMVSLSDLAAMGATGRYVLVALTLPDVEAAWVASLAAGMAEAAGECDVYICGGNLARGPLSITVSVHGEVPEGRAVVRHNAAVGDKVWVSGVLGGAAACVRQQAFAVQDALSDVQLAYFRPRARFDLIEMLAEHASAAVDVSDGLVADAGHIARASSVTIELQGSRIPLHLDAQLDDALYGGDEYQLLVTAPGDRDLQVFGMTQIGAVMEAGAEPVSVDGEPPAASGFDHFAAAHD